MISIDLLFRDAWLIELNWTGVWVTCPSEGSEKETVGAFKDNNDRGTKSN